MKRIKYLIISFRELHSNGKAFFGFLYLKLFFQLLKFIYLPGLVKGCLMNY